MPRKFRLILSLSLLSIIALPVLADYGTWEYRVVIVQGITTGGTIEKQSSGVYIDTKRTTIINELAADGWEVVSVIGLPNADHTVYLRRESRR